MRTVIRFTFSIDTPTIYILLALALCAIGIDPAYAQIASFLVGSDHPTTITPTGQLTTFPDEHVTFMPQGGGSYLLFGSSAVQGGMGGAVVLES